MSKYRVMFLLSKKENLNDLYKFATTEIDGKVFYREFTTLEEADAYIETLLNQQGYSKEDILLVREKEFEVCIKTEDSGTGESGQDGFSPIAKVVQTETGATITITDKTGTTTATVNNGKNGKDGTDGTNGEDGFSPTIVENSANNDSTYKLDITNKTGSFTTPNLKGGSSTTSTTPLSGKKILLCGDSIMRGAGWSGAYKNLIEEDFPDAIVYNYAVDGAKFTTNSIYDQFYEAAITDSLTPDIILFNGGGNDILVGKSLGTVDEDSAIDLTNLESYDDTTMLGAFEKLLANMNNVESLYSAHIGYINTYKLKSGVYSGESTVPEISVQRSSWEQVQKLCNKWSIPCLDLFNKSNIDSNNSMCVSKYFKNGTDIVHVNEAGYRKLWPMVREFLLTLS